MCGALFRRVRFISGLSPTQMIWSSLRDSPPVRSHIHPTLNQVSSRLKQPVPRLFLFTPHFPFLLILLPPPAPPLPPPFALLLAPRPPEAAAVGGAKGGRGVWVGLLLPLVPGGGPGSERVPQGHGDQPGAAGGPQRPALPQREDPGLLPQGPG